MCSSKAQAQSYRYANEALLFSQYGVSGSARTVGLGNAQTALGADLGSVWMNPAGAGLFNRNEVSFSPTLRFSSNEALYNGSLSFNDRTNFNFQNLGAVFNWRDKDRESGFLGGSLAISYNQLANFNEWRSYEGEVTDYGLINGLVYAFDNGIPDATTDLAFETFLLGDYYYYDDNNNELGVATPAFFPSANFPAYQRESIQQSGSMSTFNVAYGGNFSDKYYFGMGINLLNIDYRRNSTFREIYQPEDDVTGLELYEDQLVSGAGINVAFGLIARPVDELRLGISYQTPSVLSLDEEYSIDLGVNYNSFTVNSGDPDGIYLDEITGEFTFNGTQFSDQGAIESFYEYQLRTPSRLNIGAAYFIGKSGFISADIERVNYSGARLSDEEDLLNDDNLSIREDYDAAFNYRIGTEWRVDALRFRAGYVYQGDPYQNQDGLDRYTQAVTFGAGLRAKRLYADLGIQHQFGTVYYIPYQYDRPAQPVEFTRIVNSGVLTVGLNF